ncbi:MAG TPA: SLC13 family permease [Gemmataceae bacterium]|nr:SLC13 family permease [Gemmataceae bacterium]
MQWQAAVTLGVLVLVLGMLALTRVGPDLVMLGGMTLLLTARVLTPEEALAGFANESVMTVAALFVVAAGVRETGAIVPLAERVLGRPTSLLSAQARAMLPSAAISAFINNTPLVAMLLPVVNDWARKNGIPASKILLPFNYAVILGGLCTLIGTSTNLIVNGMLITQAGLPGLGLFDPTWVGVPCAVAGLAYLLAFGRHVLPDRESVTSALGDSRAYTVEMMVDAGSILAGQSIEQAGLRRLPGLYLMEIEREGEVLAAVGGQERLLAGDRLVFVGLVESVVDLQKIRGLKPATNQVFKLDAPRSHRCLIEAVVSDTCPLVGQTIRDGRFRSVYGAAIIAVARNGERVQKKIGDIVLQPGDTLLLETHPVFAERQRNSRDFFLVGRVENSTPPPHERAGVALAIVTAMVALAGFGLLRTVNAAMLAAGAMILGGCCTGAHARRAIDWPLLLVIGASFGIGRAMQVSGAADLLVGGLTHGSAGRPWLALALVYLAMMLCAEIMSRNAAVALVFPVAMATARSLSVSPMPFAMAVMMAASCGFASPVAYQTNMMVYGPGGYRFGDYLRFGGPLNLIVGVVTILLAPLIWPFR